MVVAVVLAGLVLVPGACGCEEPEPEGPGETPASRVLGPGDVPSSATGAVLAEARAGNGGVLPLEVALDLFASVHGPIAGGEDRFGSVRAGDGSLALRALGAHWDELGADQRRSVDAAMGPEEEGPEGTGGQALVGRRSGVVEVRQGELQRLAEEAAEDISYLLGWPLAATLKVHAVGPSTWRGRDVAGDAAPLRSGAVVWAGGHDACRIRIDRTVREVEVTVAHEVFHCFQYEMAPLDRVAATQDWIVEGGAEWAAASVRGADGTVVGHFDQWLGAGTSLFDLDYEALGYFWTIETLGADPWEVVPRMMGVEGAAAVGLSGLEPAAVAARMATGTVRRSLDELAVDEVWDLTPRTVPLHGYRDVGEAGPGRSIVDFDDAAAAFSRLPPRQVRVSGTGVTVEAEGSAGAVQLVGGELQSFTGRFRTRLCLEGGGPHEVLVTVARTDPGPLSLSVVPDDLGCGLAGRWVVEQPAEVNASYGNPVLEIRAGPEPAPFTGSQIAPATDCPLWGDLRLDEAVDPENPEDPEDAGLRPPVGTTVTEAWTGTITLWCLGNPDDERGLTVGLLDDGRIVVGFRPAVRSFVLQRVPPPDRAGWQPEAQAPAPAAGGAPASQPRS